MPALEFQDGANLSWTVDYTAVLPWEEIVFSEGPHTGRQGAPLTHSGFADACALEKPQVSSLEGCSGPTGWSSARAIRFQVRHILFTCLLHNVHFHTTLWQALGHRRESGVRWDGLQPTR